MGNKITTRDTSNGQPPPMPAEMRSGLDLLLTRTHPEGNGIYSMSETEMPTSGQRRALCTRRDELSVALCGAGADGVRRHLAAVMGVLPGPPGGDEGRHFLDAYCAALCDLPGWAIEATCLASLRGQVGGSGGRFMPGPGEMHYHATRLVSQVREERRKIERVLNARIEPPRPPIEERRAIVARARGLMSAVVEGARP